MTSTAEVSNSVDPATGRHRVVHVTSAHRPEDNRIHWRQCASLAEASYEVFLVAHGPAPERVAPGVTVVPVDPAQGGRVKRSTLGAFRVAQAAAKLDPDVIHLHDPELVLVLGYLRVRTKAKIVLDLHEDVPLQLQHKPYLPPAVGAVLAPTARAALRMTRPLVDRYVVAWPHPIPATPEDRTVEVHNYPSLEEFSDLATATAYAEREPLIVSIGTITEQRALFEIVEASRLLGTGVRVVMAGPILTELSPDQERDIEESPAELPGRLPQSGVGGLLATARVGLCLLHPTPQYQVAEPTKVFEYLLAGLPIVGCDFGPTKAIIDRHQCGLTVDPLDPNAITEAIRWLLEHPEAAAEMAQRAKAASVDYVWERQAETLVETYRELLTPD